MSTMVAEHEADAATSDARAGYKPHRLRWGTTKMATQTAADMPHWHTPRVLSTACTHVTVEAYPAEPKLTNKQPCYACLRAFTFSNGQHILLSLTGSCTAAGTCKLHVAQDDNT